MRPVGGKTHLSLSQGVIFWRLSRVIPEKAMPMAMPINSCNIRAFPDFSVHNHGTIFLLRPHTERARNWISEHIPHDAHAFGEAVVVEHRFIADIVNGIRTDGLEVR
jgi:hypothetical protein